MYMYGLMCFNFDSWSFFRRENSNLVPNKIAIMLNGQPLGGGGAKPVSHTLGCAFGVVCKLHTFWVS